MRYRTAVHACGRRVWRRLKWPLGALAVWFIVHTAVSIFVGCRDDVGPADIAVVFGNKVNEDGTLSRRLRARLDRALELHGEGRVTKVLVSGGLGREGHEEALAMRKYLLEQGVADSAIVVDTLGYTTYRTAANAAAFMAENELSSALLVTHYYHVIRARLAFRSFGVTKLNHACARIGPELREPLSLVREFVGFYYYAVREY